jgi:hypothetical protein
MAMNGLRVLKAGLIIGTIMVTTIFSAVSGYAQVETDMSATPGQDMTNMTSGGQETKMDMSESQEDKSTKPENHETKMNISDSQETKSNISDSHKSETEVSSGYEENKTEEAIPWTFIYGFLALNGFFVLVASVMKAIKLRRVVKI